MTYTKKEFGLELNKKISEEKSLYEIARWSFEVYNEKGLELEEGLDYFVLKLVMMEEGPDFFLSKMELQKIAKELIGENGG